VSRSAIVTTVLLAAFVAAAWRTGGAVPVLGSIALFFGTREIWQRIVNRKSRAARFVHYFVQEDLEEAAALAARTDLRALSACGHSDPYDALIKEAVRMMPGQAGKLVDDFVTRARAQDDPRLLANAIALRAIVRARTGPQADAFADADEVEAMANATPTAKAHAALARVIAADRAEQFDEVRSLAVRRAALLADCTDEFGQRVVKDLLASTTGNDASPVPSWRADASDFRPAGKRRELARWRDPGVVLGVGAWMLLATATIGIVAAAVILRRPSIVWWEVFAMTSVAISHLVLTRGPPYDLVAALSRSAVRAGWAGELSVEELARISSSAEGCLVRARIAEREARFADALAACNDGLARARRASEQHALSELRAVTLAALDRDDEAENERRRIPPFAPLHERAYFRLALVQSARAFNVANAVRAVKQLKFDGKLQFREKILAELVLAVDEANGRERVRRIIEVIDADEVLERWCKAIAPQLLARASQSIRETPVT
jgi:hypothetical protein